MEIVLLLAGVTTCRDLDFRCRNWARYGYCRINLHTRTYCKKSCGLCPKPPTVRPKPPTVRPKPPTVKPKPPTVRPKPPTVRPKPPTHKPTTKKTTIPSKRTFQSFYYNITWVQQSLFFNSLLLYGEEYFTGNWNTHWIHTPLHPGPEWRIFRMSIFFVSYRSVTSRFPPFPALLNELGFFRRLLLRIMANTISHSFAALISATRT